MAAPTKSQRDAATRLLTLLRLPASAGEGDEFATAGRVLNVLFTSLGPVIGVAGVAAIFARSIKLSKTDCLPLANMMTSAIELRPPKPEDIAMSLVEYLHNLEPAVARESATNLFATFLRLLSNFMGEELLWQIVKSALPTDAEVELKEAE